MLLIFHRVIITLQYNFPLALYCASRLVTVNLQLPQKNRINLVTTLAYACDRHKLTSLQQFRHILAVGSMLVLLKQYYCCHNIKGFSVYEISFWFLYAFPHFNNLLYFDLLMKFWTDFIIYGTEEGPICGRNFCLTLRKECYWIKRISFQKRVYHGFKPICYRISNIFIGSCSIFLCINSIHAFVKKCFWFSSIFLSVYFLRFFLYLPLISIINVKIKRVWPSTKITKWIKILWIVGQCNSRHVLNHVISYNPNNIYRAWPWFSTRFFHA